LKNAIIAEMLHVVESYGAWEDVSFFEKGKRMLRRDQRDIRQPRFRVHRLVALILHFSQNATSNVPSVEKIKYENAVPKSEDREAQDYYLKEIAFYATYAVTQKIPAREGTSFNALKLVQTFALSSFTDTLKALELASNTLEFFCKVCRQSTMDDTLVVHKYACKHIPSILEGNTVIGHVVEGLWRINLLFESNLPDIGRLREKQAYENLMRQFENMEKAIGTCKLESKLLDIIRKGVHAVLEQIVAMIFDRSNKNFAKDALLPAPESSKCPDPPVAATIADQDGKLQRLNKLLCSSNRDVICQKTHLENLREQLEAQFPDKFKEASNPSDSVAQTTVDTDAMGQYSSTLTLQDIVKSK
jgi:hypothetical protein